MARLNIARFVRRFEACSLSTRRALAEGAGLAPAFDCDCLPYVVGYGMTQVLRRRRKIDFGVKGTSGRCALAPGVPCRSAITAQRGGEPEIIDDNIAQTVCR